MARSLPCQRWFVCSLLGIALGCSCLCWAAADLTLSRTVWDFGSIEQGETTTQKIILGNSGDQPLKIKKAELPQGFSVAPALDDSEIQPKQELEVEFTFDSSELLGKLQQYAYIFPDGSEENKTVTLTIKGEVLEKSQPRLRVTPQPWNFGSVKVGESRQQTFKIENAGTADLTIEKIQIYDQRFRIVRNITKDTLQPGETVEFVLSVTGRSPGRYDLDFYIKSNSVGSNFTKVSVQGYAVAKTWGLVISSNLSYVDNNTPYTAEVTKTHRDGKSEKLTVSRDSRKIFPPQTGTPRTPFNPADYTVTVKLMKPAPPAPKPAVEKPEEEKPETPSPEKEEKPAEEEQPEEETTTPELPEAEPVTPETSKESGKEPPMKPSPEEGESPGEKSTPPDQSPPDEPEKAEPSEKPEEKKPTPPSPGGEENPERPGEKKEPAPSGTEKKETEKPSSQAIPPKPEGPGEAKPSEGETPKPAPPPETPSESKEPSKDAEKERPGTEG